MSENEVTLGLTDEDREALNLMKEHKAALDLANKRKARLDEFVNGEATKEYAKDLLANGLQADLDANPHLLDSTENLSYAANKALGVWRAGLNTETPPVKETQPTENSAPLNPKTMAPAPQTTQQDTEVDWGKLSPDEMVSKHGMTSGQARLVNAFPPRIQTNN